MLGSPLGGGPQTWGIHNAVVSDAALTTGWDNAAFHSARLAQPNPYEAVERACKFTSNPPLLVIYRPILNTYLL